MRFNLHTVGQLLRSPSTLLSVGNRCRRGARHAALLMVMTVTASCGAPTTSEASDVVAASTPSATVEPISTPEPTATPVATATAEPTAPPAATATPEPTATPAATATAALVKTDKSAAEFALVWDALTPLVAGMLPDHPTPPSLADPAPGVYGELELTRYKFGDGVLLATSLTDGRIDGYVVFFDPDGIEALQTLLLLSLSIDEPVISTDVVQTIYLDAPSQPSDVAITFDGVNHRIEVFRTGADPVEDPLWILTAVPTGSSIDHDRLRLAGAEAARASL